MTDKVGQHIGNYRLVRLLGSGGFAEVYLGQHVLVQHLQAAIKVLRGHLSQKHQAEFLQEAETIARLKHPHIIRLLDFGIDSRDNAPYLIMDYAPYGTLRNRYPEGSIVPLGTVVSYVKQIAQALQYAHDHNLIHRDLKPENLLIGENSEIVLSDFGIAALVQGTSSMETRPYAGTVPYSAPEQILGKPRRESDQYSLAIIVYEWLTGSRPFTGTLTEIISQHLGALPRPLCEKVPGNPPAVEAVIMKALAKDPKQRFKSIQAFANALELAYIPPPHEVLPVMGHVPRQNVAVTYYPPGITNTIGERIRTWGLVSPQGKILIGLILLLVVLLSVFGGVGVYNHISQVNLDATSTATNQMTATAQAAVYSSATARAAQTATVTANPYSHGGTLVLYDPLSQPNRWTNGSGGSAGNCQFSNSALIDTASQPGETFSCVDEGDDFANFAFEVKMKILKGDCGGIDFQLNGVASYGYQVCRDGEYILNLYLSSGQSYLVIDHYSSVIHTGLGSDNTIAITVIGNKLDLYVNGTKIDSTSNIPITHGEVGVLAGTHANTQESVVAYKEAKVWKLL